MTDAPTPQLRECPFCGGEAQFDRRGDYRRSCQVSCTNCGARHESGDEYDQSGNAWNTRHIPNPPPDGLVTGPPSLPMPNPTEADLASPVFEAIWQTIKTWDVYVPAYYVGYMGANGSHVKLILDALQALRPDLLRELRGWLIKCRDNAGFAVGAPSGYQIAQVEAYNEVLEWLEREGGGGNG